MTAAEPDAVEAILHFWFEEVGLERHFAKDDALDRQIDLRFRGLRDEVLATGAEGWRDGADAMLAAIILLDQFSRNIDRGTAGAFAADPLALELALSAIAAGFDLALSPERRAFLYMPLMHAEDSGVQRFSVRCFAQQGLEQSAEFAVAHAAVIDRFGRFPDRNAALGRGSTAQELAWLADGGSGW